MKLFSIVRNQLVLNTQELMLHNAFNDLLSPKYNEGFEGDTKGELKLYAFEIFKYIYFLCDWKSPYIQLDDEDRAEKALRECKLSPVWKPDAKTKAAIKKYLDLQLTISGAYGALINLKQTVKLCESVNAIKLDKIRQQQDILGTLDLDLDDAKIDTWEKLNKILGLGLKEIFESNNSIKIALKDIEAYENVLMKDHDNIKLAKGKKEIGNRADPKLN